MMLTHHLSNVLDREGDGVLVEQESDPPRLGGSQRPRHLRRPEQQEQLRLQGLRLRLRP